tara:strand:- start:217 stop:486 length:270 start_codon:yes stop_codon:yes gene_type:complete
MSTTFGVNIKNGDQDEIVEVAFRSNGMRFTNELAHLLSEDTPVIALDNTPQGVYTIGDVKRAIEKTDPNEAYWRAVESPSKGITGNGIE